MTLPPIPRQLVPVKFKQWNCVATLSRYAAEPHPHAITLSGAPTEPYAGEPIATATVYIEGAKLAPDEVCIKSWSKNSTMVEALQKAGIIGPTLRLVPTGFVTASVHKLLVPVLE